MKNAIAPMLDLKRRRAILQSQAVIRAIDALRQGDKIGGGTMGRLRGTSEGGGGGKQGFDPVGLLQGFATLGQDNPNLAAARQEALANWTGKSIGGGPEQGRYMAPQVNAATQAMLASRGNAADAVSDRRTDLLGRTGSAAISADLRKRLLRRMQRGE